MGAKRSRVRLVLRVVLFLLLVPAVLMLCASYVGLPRPVIRKLEQAVASHGLHLEIDRATLDLAEGLVFRKVKLYRRGMIGPPMLEMGELVVGCSILRRDSRMCIVVKDGVMRSDIEWSEIFSGSSTEGGSPFSGEVSIRLENCDLQGLSISSLSCDIVADEASVEVSGVEGIVGRRRGGGLLTGHIVWLRESSEYRGQFTTRFDPTEVQTMVAAQGLFGLRNTLRRFAFEDVNPRFEADFAGVSGEGSSFTLEGVFRGAGFRYNGVEIRRATFPLSIEMRDGRQMLALDRVMVRRDEGEVSAALTIDLLHDTVRFEGSTSAYPPAVARLISDEAPSYVSDYEFGGPVRIVTKGTVCYTNPLLCEVEAVVNASALKIGRYLADECSFILRRTGRATAVSDIKATMYGGRLNGAAYFYPEPGSTNMRHRISVGIEDVDFNECCRAAFPSLDVDEHYTGTLYGSAGISGVMGTGTASTVEGKGEFTITDGNIFRIPLFGGLSDMLVDIVPGLGYVLRLTDVRTEFVIEEGRVRTDELIVEGDILALRGDGGYDLSTTELDFDIELRFLKEKTLAGEIVQIIMLPFTKMFRFRLRGTPDDPEWSSVNF